MFKAHDLSEARMEHGNAPLTPNGRLRMVLLVEEQGMTFEQAAACSNVAKSTAWTWVWRWRQASEQERARRSCLQDRPCTPKRSPQILSGATTTASASCASARAGARG